MERDCAGTFKVDVRHHPVVAYEVSHRNEVEKFVFLRVCQKHPQVKAVSNYCEQCSDADTNGKFALVASDDVDESSNLLNQ